jgi:aspartate/methionine/tyrosine aminotransferase
MRIPKFQLEEFWKKYEFVAPYNLSPSDMESWSQKEIVALADPETRSLWENLHLGYTESPGLPLLRAEIAKLYTSIKQQQILTTAGAEDGIFCTLHALLSPNDHVIVITPCYQSLQTIPEMIGADVTNITLHPERNWQLDIRDLQAVFRPNTKMIILNCPHNPTGMLLKREVFQKMISLAKASGAYIVVDEVYRYLELDESKRLPAIADAYEKGVSLNVMTKSFGLAGLRIGWVACQDEEMVQKIGSFKLYTSICNSAPSEILAVMALRAKDIILKRNRSILLHNVEILDAFFKKNASLVRWSRPESGSVAFVELILPIPIEQFQKQLVEKEGVLILPGTLFNVSGNFFRIGFGRKNMADVLQRFERFLHSKVR